MTTAIATTDEITYTPESALAWVARVNDGLADIAVELANGYHGKVYRQLQDPTTGKPFSSFSKMAEACLLARGLRMSKAQWQWFAVEMRDVMTGKEIAAICGVSAATVSRHYTFVDTGERPTADGVRTRKNGEAGAGATTTPTAEPVEVDPYDVARAAILRMLHTNDARLDILRDMLNRTDAPALAIAA